jgi:glycosyltransferase involved in cell wall biosynthesis
MDGSGEPPDVTVVVPTHRRPAALQRVLAGLAAQEGADFGWDVVVVDNDDGPGTAAPIVAGVDSFPVPIRTVREPQLGASNARNRGIAEATGTIIAFVDDDVVPDRDWLVRIVEPLLAGRSDGVGGRVVTDRSVARPPWLTPWMLEYLAEFDPAATEVDLRSLAPDVLREPYVLTANAAFTADILERCGGFDAVLGPRRGVPIVNDDLAVCRRVLAAGGAMRYVPAARVVHELPPGRLRRRYLLRRLYAQGRSDWMLDRAMWQGTKAAGVRAGVAAYAREVLDAARGRSPKPVHSFLWCHAARRAGFVREAVVSLAGRARR